MGTRRSPHSSLFCPKEHGQEPVVALLQLTLQRLLQRCASLHKRLARQGKRQQGQLYRNYTPLPRGQQGQPHTGVGQLRQSHREEPENHQAAQHKEETRVDQEPAQDGQRHRMAEQEGIQPLHVESLDADGTLPIPQRRLRRSRRHLQLHEPALPDAARHLRQGTRLAGQVLHRAGMALRRRRRDAQHGARLHRLARAQRVGLHLRRLLYPHP